MKMKITLRLLAILYFAIGSNCYCTATALQTTITPTLEVIQPSCAHPLGTITVTSPVGDGVEYSINNGPFQTSPVFSDLAPAIYCVKVKDTFGTFYETVCVEIIKVINPESPTVIVSQPDCGNPEGTIVVTSPLGSEYSYSVDNSTFQSSPIFSGLVPNTYEVTVMNTHGCTSKTTVVIITMAPNECALAGIFHTSVSCDNYQDDPGAQQIEELCYRTRTTNVLNVTPGKFYYYSFITAPSADFCVDVVQSKSCSELALFSIHQEGQIKLYSDNCTTVATGSQPTSGQASVCISNATPGQQYIVSVKYDSKSLIGATFTGLAPICLYTFESQIAGVAQQNSTTTVRMTPNCSSRIDSQAGISATVAPNPSTASFELNISSSSQEDLTIIITDANGRQLKNLTQTYSDSVHLGNDLSTGLYFIHITQGNTKTMTRAVKL